jgi:hypothetical protein
MSNRFAYVCPECLEVTWVDRVGIVMKAIKSSRRFKVCEDCKRV